MDCPKRGALPILRAKPPPIRLPRFAPLGAASFPRKLQRNSGATGILDSREELEGLIRVSLRNGETADKLVQRFKRTVAKEGLLKEIKKRNFYEKPSEARRRKAREQEKLLRKKARKKAVKDARRKARTRSLGFQ